VSCTEVEDSIEWEGVSGSGEVVEGDEEVKERTGRNERRMGRMGAILW
jgi:hypothetical protein